MSKNATTTELRKMSPADLRKEISDKKGEVAQMSMAVTMRSEKDTAKFRREKKEIARMLTILNEIERANPNTDATTLKPKAKVSTVPASTKSKARKSASTSH